MLQLEKAFLLQNLTYDMHACDILLIVDSVLWSAELLQEDAYCCVLKKLSALTVSKELHSIWQDEGTYQHISSISVQWSDVSTSVKKKTKKRISNSAFISIIFSLWINYMVF